MLSQNKFSSSKFDGFLQVIMHYKPSREGHSLPGEKKR